MSRPEQTTRKVLIVDDEPQNLQLVGEILRRAGIQFLLAVDGVEALKAVESERPDLILLDIMMPGITGIEVGKKLQASPETADIPIIFLTAATTVSDLLTGFSAGAVDYIKKPFIREELLARVTTHLKLSAAQIELNRMYALKTELLARLAHDVKNPSGAISGLAGFLLEDFSTIEHPKKNEMLSMLNLIQESAKGMTDLVNGILDDAKRGATDAANNNDECIHVGEVIEHLVRLNQLQASGKHIKLKFIPEIQAQIAISRRILIEMFDNLLSNAIKYTGMHTEVTLRLLPSKELKDGLRFQVEDEAPTISPEKASGIFQTFTQGDLETPKNQSSHGVGLAIVKRLVELHSGTVGVHARSDEKGNCFFIELPGAST